MVACSSRISFHEQGKLFPDVLHIILVMPPWGSEGGVSSLTVKGA